MPNNLLIITGAGASYDVLDRAISNPDLDYLPPLTSGLFSYNSLRHSSYINTCLINHPQAFHVGYDFDLKRKSSENTISLEEYLLGLRNSNKMNFKKQFWAIPLFLYDLFNLISLKFLPTGDRGLPSNYRVLIDRIIDNDFFHQVIWLNLNYDLLADFAIRDAVRINKFNSFHEYMNLETEDGLKIKYTKPHGSIDWFRKINENTINWDIIKAGEFSKNLDQCLLEEISFRHTLNSLDGYYPAIATPLGQYDFIYKNHIEEITPLLQTTRSVLCIGFSALDNDILELIKKNIKFIENLKIVNGTQGFGEKSYLAMHRAGISMGPSKIDSVFEGGFSDFLKKDVSVWLKSCTR